MHHDVDMIEEVACNQVEEENPRSEHNQSSSVDSVGVEINFEYPRVSSQQNPNEEVKEELQRAESSKVD